MNSMDATVEMEKKKKKKKGKKKKKKIDMAFKIQSKSIVPSLIPEHLVQI